MLSKRLENNHDRPNNIAAVKISVASTKRFIYIASANQKRCGDNITRYGDTFFVVTKYIVVVTVDIVTATFLVFTPYHLVG